MNLTIILVIGIILLVLFVYLNYYAPTKLTNATEGVIENITTPTNVTENATETVPTVPS